MNEPTVFKIGLKRLAVWLLLMVQLVVMFGVFVGYQLFPDSTLFKYAWWFLWAGVFPLLLFFGYRKMVEGTVKKDAKKSAS